MKKFFALLMTASVLAAPMAQAQGMNSDRGRDVRNERTVTTTKKVVEQKRWSRGGKLSAAQRRNVIGDNDYRRYKLSSPGRGQRWVRVDNQYLLINLASGVIVGLATGR
jgi:Ni/Co efflux regulator RcnB